MLDRAKAELQTQEIGPRRTAVLVVHGMGIQRPMQTVRGVYNSIISGPDPKSPRPSTVQFERTGLDPDLPVITTTIPTTDKKVDFHELYWAHRMSETRAIAVLLWIFELTRRGPRLRPGMNAIWTTIATFMVLLLLSASLLVFRAVLLLASLVNAPEALLTAPVLMVLVVLVLVLGACVAHGKYRLPKFLISVPVTYPVGTACFAVALIVAIALVWFPATRSMAAGLIPVLVLTVVAAGILMGEWFWRPFGWAMLASAFFFAIYLVWVICRPTDAETWQLVFARGWVPWALTSQWSILCACLIIGLYLVLNAVVLQQIFGDAARYFRDSPANVQVRRDIRLQAVEALEALHRSGRYDRIIVVAHSLGAVVGYDMLRTAYNRFCQQQRCSFSALQPEFDQIDYGQDYDPRLGREVIRKLVGAEQDVDPAATWRSWLVTDFVTMGCPLTHGKYLMCRGKTFGELARDFRRRVREREFPVCPPRLPARKSLTSADEGRLTATEDGVRMLHPGGLFGLTRWTNLYFPVKEILWGDPFGGRLKDTFGTGIVDVEVFQTSRRETEFFEHADYWFDLPPGPSDDIPHLLELRAAVNLADV